MWGERRQGRNREQPSYPLTLKSKMLEHGISGRARQGRAKPSKFTAMAAGLKTFNGYAAAQKTGEGEEGKQGRVEKYPAGSVASASKAGR